MRKTYYPCNVCGKRFNTATKRTTHEMNIKNSKVKADFGRFKIITINIQPDYLITLEDKVEHITDILNHEMKSSLKFYISAYVKINLDGGGKYIAEHFQSKATLHFFFDDFCFGEKCCFTLKMFSYIFPPPRLNLF